MKRLIESFGVLKGLPFAKTLVVGDVNDLDKVRFPYYMKVDSGGHKLKMGGVVLCQDIDEAKKNFAFFKKKFKENVVIQEEIRGVELIVGVKEDDVFGKMILVGIGGSFVEEKAEVSFRALPITQHDIRSMLSDLSVFDSLEKKGFATKKLIKFIEVVANISEMRKVVELDLNPVIFNKSGVYVVDARLEVG
jgi:acetate---CoA ligase (ADP-forming)